MHKLVYTDENDLRTYESLPEKDFKEFFMAYFKYNKGDNIDITDFTNPITFALFNSYIPKLDKNEDTYNKKVNANRENGKKGGRPKKSALQDTVGTEFDIPEPENENKPILTPQIIQDDNQYQPEVESALNSLKVDKNEVKQNIPMVEEKPVVKIAANKQNSDAERVQELINTDDDFYTAYVRYINASIDYINDPKGRCTATSKEMAKVRLKEQLDKHHILFNKDVMEMINGDINETMKIRNTDVA